MSASPRETLSPRESVVVLTQDDALVQTLQAVVSEHELFLVAAEADLAAHLVSDHAGVAVLDAACISSPIARLAERLKSQFPDLVLVVAGDVDDQGALAAQITNGTVYRFLHKPVSEQRVKLFIDAAWRRHGEEHAGIVEAQHTSFEPAGGTPLPRNLLVMGGAAALAFVLIAWFVLREPGTSSDTVAPAAVQPANAPAQQGRDDVLEQILARADAALERGALVVPPGDSAADLYKQALARRPEEPRALAGVKEVVDRLLTGAEQALLEERLDDATQLTDAARSVQPDNVRVAFLTTQIGKERERALLTQARQAASSGDIEQAISVLDSADGAQQSSSTLVAEARQELVQQRSEERVRDYLRRASDRMRRGALVEPAQDNARFLIESARALAPNDPAVRQAQRQLADRLVSEARNALTAGNAEQGERWIAAAAESGAGRDDIAALNREVQRVRIAAKADAMARLMQQFNQRLSENKLVEPADDSAKFYLAQLAQSDPEHPSTQLARQTLSGRVLDQARAAVSRQDFAAARRWIAEARGAGAGETGVLAVEQEITAAQEAAERANQVIAATALERTRYVAPEYPANARERGTSGWVDLQFTVRTDGTVGDVTVVAAEPAGVFEQAAMDAVRRWRYRPPVQNGTAVDQQARLRIRFALQ